MVLAGVVPSGTLGETVPGLSPASAGPCDFLARGCLTRVLPSHSPCMCMSAFTPTVPLFIIRTPVVLA